MNSNSERSFCGVPQLSLRSLIFGMIGSAIITASSMYVALRMSALPWPTAFVAVLSMALLKSLGGTTLNEINVTQTSMSAGAMVAGGIAFTLPGLWIAGIWSGPQMAAAHFWQVFAISLAGMLLGTIATWYLRLRFVEQDPLPYPIGIAAAETIKAGDAGGKKAKLLFGTMGASALFTFCRDQLTWIPAALTSKWLYTRNFYVGIWLSPMAVGIGYMIGTLYTGVWFLGAILSYLVFIPLATFYKIVPAAAQAVAFKNTVGIGLMIGTGIGILVPVMIGWMKGLASLRTGTHPPSPVGSGRYFKSPRILVYGAILVAFCLSLVCGLQPWPAVLFILGVGAASAMAASITGETGINPMEIFGIIVLLAIRLLSPVDAGGAFFIAAGVAIACGYAGDLLNDYKTGNMLGTNPVAQLIAQIAGGIVGTLVASLAMFAIIQQFGGIGLDKGLPAGQAYAVAQMVQGVGNPVVLGVAISIGVILYLLKIPVMTLGLGIYLPFEISAALFVGGIIRFVHQRLRPQTIETGTVTASGLFGGEGITGVMLAIYKILIRG